MIGATVTAGEAATTIADLHRLVTIVEAGMMIVMEEVHHHHHTREDEATCLSSNSELAVVLPRT
jgi:hypothetical protein